MQSLLRFPNTWPPPKNNPLGENTFRRVCTFALVFYRYEESIKTIEDLAKSDITWAGTHDAWTFSILDATDPNLIKIVSQYKTLPEKVLHERSTTKNLAYGIERLPFGHFAIGSYITREAVPYLQVMIQDLYWEQCVFMMRKSSPHLEGFNTLIGRMHAAGLMEIWEREVKLQLEVL